MVLARLAHHDTQEVPDFCGGDVGEGVVLDQGGSAPGQALKDWVHLDDWDGLARAGALVFPLPCDPCLEAPQLPPQRPHLLALTSPCQSDLLGFYLCSSYPLHAGLIPCMQASSADLHFSEKEV